MKRARRSPYPYPSLAIRDCAEKMNYLKEVARKINLSQRHFVGALVDQDEFDHTYNQPTQIRYHDGHRSKEYISAYAEILSGHAAGCLSNACRLCTFRNSLYCQGKEDEQRVFDILFLDPSARTRFLNRVLRACKEDGAIDRDCFRLIDEERLFKNSWLRR